MRENNHWDFDKMQLRLFFNFICSIHVHVPFDYLDLLIVSINFMPNIAMAICNFTSQSINWSWNLAPKLRSNLSLYIYIYYLLEDFLFWIVIWTGSKWPNISVNVNVRWSKIETRKDLHCQEEVRCEGKSYM